MVAFSLDPIHGILISTFDLSSSPRECRRIDCHQWYKLPCQTPRNIANAIDLRNGKY
jgi:hypothetical protein